jgi:hypothetical protein
MLSNTSRSIRRRKLLEPRCSRDVQIMLRHLEEVSVQSAVTKFWLWALRLRPIPRVVLLLKLGKRGREFAPICLNEPVQHVTFRQVMSLTQENKDGAGC